jgi:hypothetical protein
MGKMSSLYHCSHIENGGIRELVELSKLQYSIMIPNQIWHLVQSSPYLNVSRSSLVAMVFPISSKLLGRRSPSRSKGGTQKRRLESEKIHPSSILELFVNIVS